MIDLVLEQFDQEPFRRSIDLKTIDLTADRKRYQAQWSDAGRAETEQIAAATNELVTGLVTAAQGTDAELKRLGERLALAASSPGQPRN